MATRMKPKDRESEILEAAIRATHKRGFANVRQKDIADEAACAFGLVTRYFNTMAQMRRAIMRAAIKRGDATIVGQGLGVGDSNARKAPDDLKQEALKLLAQ